MTPERAKFARQYKWTDERREKMRELHRKRLGNPVGHRTLYGVHVPDEVYDPMRRYIESLRSKKGTVEDAKKWLEKQREANWEQAEMLATFYAAKDEIRKNTRLINMLKCEVLRYAHKNSR